MNKQNNPQDQYNYNTNPSWFTKLLWHSAGADLQLLMKSPSSDRAKYQGLGGVVLATTALAFLSGSYAFYVVFGPKSSTAVHDAPVDLSAGAASVLFGLVWALIIYNLDRFIVGSSGSDKQDGVIGFMDIINSIPRILMALIIGVCLSKPLEIRILKTEIDSRLSEIQEDKRQEYNQKTDKDYQEHFDRIDNKVKALEQSMVQLHEGAESRRVEKRDYDVALDEEIAKMENDFNKIVIQRETEINDEITGKSSGFKGVGKRVEAMKQQLEEYKLARRNEINSKKTANAIAKKRKSDEYNRFLSRQSNSSNSIHEQIENFKAEKQEYFNQREEKRTENQMKAQKLDGLMKRIQIADEIGGNIPFAIMCLLIAIEICPIFFKMLLVKSTYDYLKENQQRLALANFGIEAETTDLINGSVEETSAKFHAAKTAIELETRRLEIERDLNLKSMEAQSKHV